MLYKHTQIGHLMIFVFLVIAVYFGFLLKMPDFDEPFAIIVLVLVLLIIASFASLNVMIDENYLRIKFGYGIFRKRFELKEIASAKAVKNHWYYGWGIRVWFRPRMVIFNVSGFNAIEIKMKNGKLYRIGTDEPKDLEYAILQSIK